MGGGGLETEVFLIFESRLDVNGWREGEERV